jgi:hypothetical protein
MNAVIWSGATNAADIFFLVAAILAGLGAILHLSQTTVERSDVLLPAAVCFAALGLLAL